MQKKQEAGKKRCRKKDAVKKTQKGKKLMSKWKYGN